MHERTNIQLSAVDRCALEAVVANRNSPQKHVWRAKYGTAEIMRATGKAKTVIWRWQERFQDEGAAGLWRDKTRPSRVPPLSPEVTERVVALTLAGPPLTASHLTGAAMAKAACSRGSWCRRVLVSSAAPAGCGPASCTSGLHNRRHGESRFARDPHGESLARIAEKASAAKRIRLDCNQRHRAFA
jgi:hypothetical protein